MKRELDYFKIENSWGGYQEWFTDWWMRIGGCAAVAACDTCIYMELQKGKEKLYPFDKMHLCREDYVRFGMQMKPYLRPRMGGIDRLELYMDGFGSYLKDVGETKLKMEGFSGEHSAEEAKMRIKEQIDQGFLIPYLNLKHQNPVFKDYVWHWFLLTGYEQCEKRFLVKAVTYAECRWLDLTALWTTGYQKKGGLILYRMDE